MLGAPDPAAELMQLREPESLCALDHHDGRVRDVDSDLDHARGHEDVGVAAHEPVHALGLLACRHPSVEQFDAQIRKDAGAETLEFGRRTAGAELVGFLDERADDERLAALADLGADELVGGTTLVGWDDASLDGMPSRRHLAQLAEVDVPVERVRQRPRDRRGGHGQVVGHRTRRLPKPLSLGDAEAMLLVDHDEAEVDHGDVVLDQRVRPDNQRVVASREPGEDLPARRRGRAAHQQSRWEAVRGEEPVEGRMVLAGEDLGRSHDRRLEPGAVGHERCQRGDHGLAAADVSLKEPVHRTRRGEIGEDLVPGDALTVGERERQGRDETSRNLDVVPDDHSRPAHAPAPRALCGNLEQEQLLECDPLPSARGALDAVRFVHLVKSFSDRHQALRLANGRRQMIGHLGRQPEQRFDPGAQKARGDAVGFRVHGRERSDVVLVLPGALEDGAAKRQPGSRHLDLAADHQLHPGLQLLDEKRLVEPHRRCHRAVVFEGCLDEHHLLVRAAPRADIADAHMRGLHDPHLERSQRDRVSRVLVASGQVEEQVSNGADAEPLEPLRLSRTDPREFGTAGGRARAAHAVA